VGIPARTAKGTAAIAHSTGSDPARQRGCCAADQQHPGALKITIRKFLPRHRDPSTQLKGVTPDIVLPSVNNYLEVGEAAIDNPIAVGHDRRGRYEKVNL